MNNIILQENVKIQIADYIIRNNKLIITEDDEYEMNIDIGTVNIYNVLYNLGIESTNISISNEVINNMIYYFNNYIFEISNKLVRFRGEVINMDKFIVNVSLGRILIQDQYHSFTVINNEMIIGPITNYTQMDLDRMPEPAKFLDLNILYQNRDQLIRNRKVITPELKNLAKDRQNVHDSYVLNKFKEIINKLNKNIIITKAIDEVIAEIKEYIDSKYTIFSVDYYKIKKANESIKYIKQNNGFIAVYNMYELQVLRLVWNTIYNNENLKDMLLNALLDMQSSKDVFYCLTGRVTRMIDIFNGVIDDFKFEKYDVRQEMMNKCVKIRNELEGNNIEDKDNVYKNEIKKQLHIDYVDSNILTLDEFNKEINEWIDYI